LAFVRLAFVRRFPPRAVKNPAHSYKHISSNNYHPVSRTHTGPRHHSADNHLTQSETHILHIDDGGAEVHLENFALRDVSPRLLDAQSLLVVVMFLLDGPAVLVANASEDVRHGPVDILCKQHQFWTVSDESWLQSTPVIVSRHGYGRTNTS